MPGAQIVSEIDKFNGSLSLDGYPVLINHKSLGIIIWLTIDLLNF